MNSIWNENLNKPTFEKLKCDIKTDVLIVGGGITGILCAYMLKKIGINAVLVEADRICKGVTGYTTAKITVQHGLIYDKIIKKYGVEAARKYFKAQLKATEAYYEICSHINCDYKKKDSYVFSLNDRKSLEREMVAYEKVGINGEFCDTLDIPLEISGALRISNQAQINPLEFCFSLAKDLKIYENTKVQQFFKGGVITNGGKIFAEKIIVATHFPIINKHGLYFLKMYQHRSYAIALANAILPDGMYVDADIKGLSFREHNGKLLLGGGSHRTGKKGGNWEELRNFASLKYPEATEVGYWATQDCMTLDSIPYIGHYSKNTPNLYVATGFNKWGMTSAMISALILSDMISDKENDFCDVFSPSRSMLHFQSFVNAAEFAVNLLTPTVPRCPHLGCALKYNKIEHSWDCPCHGSRFSEDGKLIENPATDDKKF